MSKLHFTTKHANEATVQRNWYVVDGTNQTVGRMCAKIAAVLRGKNKAYFTPHVDCGDFVIVINADKIKAPLMVLQGANDPRVLQIESDEIVAAARKNGVPVEYEVFPDEGHGFVKKENEIRGYSGILAFLDTHLKGEKPLAADSAASVAVPVTGADSTKGGARK